MLFWVNDRMLQNPLVVSNTICVPRGAMAEAGIRISGNAVGRAAVEGGRITGSRVSADGNPQYGMFFDRSTTDLQVEGSWISDFTDSGIALTAHREMQLGGNTVAGPGGATAAVGVVVQEGSGLSFDGNSVADVAIGLQAAGQPRWTAVRDNAFDSVGTGVDLQDASERSSAPGTSSPRSTCYAAAFLSARSSWVT